MSLTYAGNPNEMRRRQSSKAQILAALQAAGSRGCTNDELNAVAYRYGGRIKELRDDGHDIESINEGAGLFRYVLHVPARIKPGQPGYLASLPVLASITGRPVRPVAPTAPATDSGRLF
jgi:hypothetical protein